MPLSRSLVVMGVSGSGKSTIGGGLAAALGLPFVEGDELHPERNRRKMAAGIPLDDADRAPWLDAVAAVLEGEPVVVACSALKRRYRDRLREAAPDLVLIYLHGTAELLSARIEGRSGHFMSSSLLQSQLDALEEPGGDEAVLQFDVGLHPDEIIELAVRQLEKLS